MDEISLSDEREGLRMTDRRRLREFLLGGLASGDADALEERMFTDDALYQQLEEEHEALVEEYVADSLTGEDAARFERQRNLSPELALRVAELRSLKTLLERGREEHKTGAAAAGQFWRPLPVAMAVCIFGLVLLFCLQWRQNQRLQAELALKVEAPQSAVKAIPVQAGQTEGVVFLAAGVVRGPQDVARVEITRGTSLVQLQIEVTGPEAGAKSWMVEVSRDGQEIFRSDAIAARHVGSISYLPVYIAAESLPQGTYSVRIHPIDSSHSNERRTFTIRDAMSPK